MLLVERLNDIVRESYVNCKKNTKTLGLIMSEQPKAFVRFEKFNTNTLYNLIFKKIWFSTVFEFNDFTEVCWLPDVCLVNKDEKIIDKIGKYFNYYEKRQKFIKKIKNNLYITPSYNDRICKSLENNNFEELLQDWKNVKAEEILRLILANIANIETGIFCVSSWEIFSEETRVICTERVRRNSSELCKLEQDCNANGATASVMLAHYAQNGAGLILIYQIDQDDSKHKPVLYEKYKSSSPGEVDLGNFFESIEARQNLFLRKFPSWRYEHEYRFFHDFLRDKNNSQKESSVGIKLVGILYTYKLLERDRSLLSKINEQFYSNKLIIEQVHPSFSNGAILFYHEDNKKVNIYKHDKFPFSKTKMLL